MGRAEIVVPGSTSNLGASFDACGLALSLYLRVQVEERAAGFEVVPSGEGAETVPQDESNLIVRVARFVAEERGTPIGGARLLVDNQIPLARGLGSSSAAIIAGISVYEALSGESLQTDELFGYALHFEEHGDNLAPSLLGGLAVACVVAKEDGRHSLLTVKRPWPEVVKVVLAIPDYEMDTQEMRRALPREVTLMDAVFNIQRAALLQAALAAGRFDLFGEALRDRLHQPYRLPFGAGLREVLKLNDSPASQPGLLGVAVSGAGSTMIAFATENSEEIGGAMSERLKACGVAARTLEVSVDNAGRVKRSAE
jgi:homoserine kinase